MKNIQTLVRFFVCLYWVVVADDKFLGGLKTYAKGVEGKVPGGDKK
jgi:hypothetical protein